MNGILNICKPKGISSYQVVSRIKHVSKIKKAGHTGTLDPFASGVLLVCLNQATRIAEILINLEKRYLAEMTLGISTDTYDLEGKIVQKKEVESNLDPQKINLLFQKYKGKISQIPPMFSAIHYQGKRLYHLARTGKMVERKPRIVNIFDLSLIDFIPGKNPMVKFEVACSKGTYIRTLCNDLGNDLGCGAHLSNLTRIKIGDFGIEDSIKLKDIEKDNTLISKKLISLNDALNCLDQVIIETDEIKKLINGNAVLTSPRIINSAENKSKSKKLVRIVNNKGNLLAIGYRIKENNSREWLVKPQKVFNQL